MIKEFGKIYAITNNVNGKQYIGQTIGTLGERWAGHKCDSKRKTNAIALAISKYSPENFKIELIEDDIPYELLDEKEIYYIKKYNTICPNGYNISAGGQSYRTEEERQQMSLRVLGENNPMYGMYGESNPFFGKKHSIETREILTEINKNNWINKSDEQKENEINRLREMNKKYYENNYSGMKGKHHSKETKKRVSESLVGRVFTDEHKKKIRDNNTKRRKVTMFDKITNEKIDDFNSMTEACVWIVENTRFIKAKAGQISNACLGKIKTAYGYKWMYLE